NNKAFLIWKFKTMIESQESNGKLLKDHQIITKLGSFLRRTSLDELPQLLNVLKGDMSLVGPRPLLPEYLPLYTERQKRRHEVKPGITGWAQIHGRDQISWEEQFELDLYYVENQSFWLDLKIIMLTFLRLFQKKVDGGIKRGKFKGNQT
ncbi:sugar transferase, partial [Xanthovirga aplysinae]|uniref:sugar transferase n=1 Tax=Xanthovirga aplysinae TaxID=2529853 RepID=UPI0012BB7C47